MIIIVSLSIRSSLFCRVFLFFNTVLAEIIRTLQAWDFFLQFLSTIHCTFFPNYIKSDMLFQTMFIISE